MQERPLLVGAMGLFLCAPSLAQGDGVSFQTQVLPILSNNCFKCHGPDEGTRDGGFRLDTPEGARTGGKNGPALVPGSASASLLIKRITSADPKEKMPPPESGKHLTEGQVATLRAWIDGGARYEKHWAFVPPQRPEVPPGEGWGRNEIDRFIAAALDVNGLAPNAEASRETLIRRLSLDLTGLPPTPEEVDAFLADGSADAYERLVDRLLASPRYGERMAMDWLDAARYADTNGYHIDNERFMWVWRDWVIDAFNANMPYDRFTVEQIAGDLLPDATDSQRVASGFNRNHMINFEGGAIPEEYKTEYIVDRVNTTGTVWLGLTLGCARCHDHKYDPVSMKDYYGLYAFFNNLPEQGLDGQAGNSVPLMKAASEEQKAELARLGEHVKSLEARINGPMPEVDAAQARWEGEMSGKLAGRWSVLDPEAFSSFGGATMTEGADHSLLVTGTNPVDDVYEIEAAVGPGEIAAIRLEALADPALPGGGPGRFDNANYVLTEFEVEAAAKDGTPDWQRVAFVGAQSDYDQPTFDVSKAIDGDPKSGWAVLREGMMGTDRAAVFVADRAFGFDGGTRLRVRLRHESIHNKHAIGRVRLAVARGEELRRDLAPSIRSNWMQAGPFTAVPPDQGGQVFAKDYGPEAAAAGAGGAIDLAATYLDGKVKWEEKAEYADGRVHNFPALEHTGYYLYRTMDSPKARRIELSLGSDDSIRVWVNGKVVLDNGTARGAAPDQDRITVELAPGVNHVMLKVVNYGGPTGFYFKATKDDNAEVPLGIERIAARGAGERTEAEGAALKAYYREKESPEYRAMKEELASGVRARDDYDKAIPTAMVMQEMESMRETFLLKRGQYDQPADRVMPSVPSFLPPLPAGRADRLALAEWLLLPEHPLTARVAVNRLWQMVFGVGLVETAEDFGIQGRMPSNQALLDWLAVEFRESGWDMRHLLRMMVTSGAYRQESRVSALALEKDPANRLVSRGPRYRLPAETIRDNALFVSGLLVEKVGGPSVRPYHPAGLWEEMSIDGGGNNFSAQTYVQDHGEALYRRTMYHFWKRSVPPPTLVTFDAPSREVCTVRRPRTNTPLQALVLMNDPTYVEAARKLAERAMRDGGATDEERIGHMARLSLGRRARAEEVRVLRSILDEQRAVYRSNEAGAKELLSVGESMRDEALEAPEVAAWTMVATTILNMDEVISKN